MIRVGDLGARQARTSRQHLNLGERIMLIDVDGPDLSAQRPREAAEALEDHEAAWILARDGG